MSDTGDLDGTAAGLKAAAGLLSETKPTVPPATPAEVVRAVAAIGAGGGAAAAVLWINRDAIVRLPGAVWAEARLGMIDGWDMLRGWGAAAGWVNLALLASSMVWLSAAVGVVSALPLSEGQVPRRRWLRLWVAVAWLGGFAGIAVGAFRTVLSL